MMKQLSVLRISYELMAKILGLSDDHEVVNIFHEERDKKVMCFGVVIKGPKMMEAPEANELAWTWEIPQRDGTMIDVRNKYKKYPYIHQEHIAVCACEGGPTGERGADYCKKCGRPIAYSST